MNTLTPLVFEPILKSMLWGGRRLPDYLGCPAPHSDPIGEAWMLSDVAGNHSVVAHGPHAGRTLRDLIAEDPAAIFGKQIPADGRFPLLFKFIDARQELSVQVHPNDEQALKLKGPGHRGKTEAWIILAADPEMSKVYAGFQPGMTAERFRAAMKEGTVPATLYCFTPKPGDTLFLEAGTVHAIGANILLFEVQQTSDITYRLYDWDRVEAKTGQPRQLHIEDGLTCSNFATGPCYPVVPRKQGNRDRVVECRYFTVDHIHSDRPMSVGAQGECRVVTCIQGEGQLGEMPIRNGSVVLIPADVGEVQVVPTGSMRLLECQFQVS